MKVVTVTEGLRATAVQIRALWSAATPALDKIGSAIGSLSRGVGVWLRRLLFIAIFLLPLAHVSVGLFYKGWKLSPTDAAKTMWVALTFVLFGLAWLVIWLVFVSTHTLVRSAILGSSVGPRLIAALVVAGVCWNSLAATIWGLARSVWLLGVRLPSAVGRLAVNLIELTSKPDPSQQPAPHAESALIVPHEIDSTFATSLLGHFLKAADVRLTEFAKNAQAQLDFRSLVVALVAWLALAFVLQALDTGGVLDKVRRSARALWNGTGEKLKSNLALLRAYRKLNWPNVGFALIALTGMFLSLAAITSLPRLRENTKANDAVSVEQLRRELEGLKLSKDELASYYSDEIRRDPLAAPEGPSNSHDTVAGVPKGAPPPEKAVMVTPVIATGTQATATLEPSKLAHPTKQADVNTLKTADQTAKTTDSAATQPVPSAAPKEKDSKPDGDIAAARDALGAAETQEFEAFRAVGRLSFDEPPEKREAALSNALKTRAATQRAREALDLARGRAELPNLIEEHRRGLRLRWINAHAQYSGLREFIVSNETSSALGAVSAYALQNIERHGSREEAIHFLQVRSWFDEKTSSHREALRTCSEQIYKFRAALLDWNSAVDSIARSATDAETLFDKKLRLSESRLAATEQFDGEAASSRSPPRSRPRPNSETPSARSGSSQRGC
jgi:hypothetical protein